MVYCQDQASQIHSRSICVLLFFFDFFSLPPFHRTDYICMLGDIGTLPQQTPKHSGGALLPNSVAVPTNHCGFSKHLLAGKGQQGSRVEESFCFTFRELLLDLTVQKNLFQSQPVACCRYCMILESVLLQRLEESLNELKRI